MVWALLAFMAWAGMLFEPGLSGEMTHGGIIGAVALVSTNAAQTATVKAVYEWPVWGTVEERTVKPVTVQERVNKVETLTNWCDWVTDTYTVSGGKTNYYAGITVATNEVINSFMVMETNVTRKVEVTGKVAVTNALYSLTASGGVATNGETRIVGTGARILVESAPVTIFWR